MKKGGALVADLVNLNQDLISYIRDDKKADNKAADAYYLESIYLRGSSANCLTTKINFVELPNIILATHFLKFQIKPTADDLIYESINGILLNSFKKQSFSKFIDMFNVIVRQAQPSKKYIFEIENQNKLEPFAKEVKLCIQESLQDGIALEDAHLDYNLLKKLFYDIYTVASTTNFVHNDAHLQNIQFVKDKYVLIDYGRSAFDLSIITPSDITLQQLTQLCTKNKIISNNSPNPVYKTYYRKILSENSSIYAKPDNNAMFMYDISTISMNIIKKFKNYDYKIGNQQIIQRITNNTIKVMRSTEIFKIFNNKTILQIDKLLLPGIYWFVKYYEKISNIRDNTTNSYIIIDLNNLIKKGYIWHHFQYLQLGSLKELEETEFTNFKSYFKNLEPIQALKTSQVPTTSQAPNPIDPMSMEKPFDKYKKIATELIAKIDTITVTNSESYIYKSIQVYKINRDKHTTDSINLNKLKNDFINWLTLHIMEFVKMQEEKIVELTNILTNILSYIEDENCKKKLTTELNNYEKSKEPITFENLDKYETYTTDLTCIPDLINQVVDMDMDMDIDLSYMDISSNGGQQNKKFDKSIRGGDIQQIPILKSSLISDMTQQQVKAQHAKAQHAKVQQASFGQQAKAQQTKIQQVEPTKPYVVSLEEAKKIFTEYYIKESHSPPPMCVLQKLAEEREIERKKKRSNKV
jgi:hypothetical protein